MKLYSIITPLGLIAAATAQAQNPWTFRAGYSGLADSKAQSTLKVDGYTVGIGYDLSKFKEGLSFDINYDNHVFKGAKIESPSAMLAWRTPVSPAHNYLGFGVGVLRNKVEYTVTNGSSTTTINSTKTVAGAELILGVKIDEKTSLELFGRYSNKTAGLNPSTIGLVYSKHF